MRTTLDLDEDVLIAVKHRARLEGRTAGQVLSDLARIGLRGDTPSSSDSFYGFTPLPRRGGVVSTELVEELREDDAV
jgi:hypothetical protein